MSRRTVLRMAGASTLWTPACSIGLAFAQGKSADKITIINTASDAVRTVQQLAVQQGYLTSFGLAAEHQNVADGAKVMGALISGSSDICMLSGISQIFPAVEKGADLKVLAGALVTSDDCIYSKRPEIRSVKDLEGRTIGAGAPGSLLNTLMIAVLRKNSIDPSKVTFVNVGSSTDVFRAVVAGTVDAGPAQAEYLELAEKYGVHSLTGGNLWEELPNWVSQGSFAATDTIAKKRDILVRALAAYGKVYRLIQSPNSLEAYLKARAVATGKDNDEARKSGEEQWKYIQKYKPYDVNLTLSSESLNYMQQLNVETGVQKKALPIGNVADMSLAQDAAKLLR